MMVRGILSSYTPGMESLCGTGHSWDLVKHLYWKKNENNSTYLVDINEVMTTKSMQRSCVPMCPPNISLSSGY